MSAGAATGGGLLASASWAGTSRRVHWATSPINVSSVDSAAWTPSHRGPGSGGKWRWRDAAVARVRGESLRRGAPEPRMGARYPPSLTLEKDMMPTGTEAKQTKDASADARTDDYIAPTLPNASFPPRAVGNGHGGSPNPFQAAAKGQGTSTLCCLTFQEQCGPGRCWKGPTGGWETPPNGQVSCEAQTQHARSGTGACGSKKPYMP